MKFLRSHKYKILTIVAIGCFLLVNPANATVATATASVIGNIVSVLIWIGGGILVVLIHILIWVCSYNGFVTSAAVSNGWVILRDVCNMFFILILLVIAFATVLNIEGYSWKKLLPKMLLMAVLINFSKLICGVIIDFAQVIMLTFVNGFRDIGGGNLSDMLGINQLLNISKEGVSDVTALSIAGTYLLGLAYVIVSIGVVTIILFVLVMRMVMLWILVTLSPLAYLLGALPNTSKYASKWWSQFTENVVSGPILAFFIWLSFASATADVKIISNIQTEVSTNEQSHFDKLASAGLSTAGTPDGMLKFIISIGMLIGGVIITKDLGGAAAKAVGSGMKFNKWGSKKIQDASQKAGKFAAQTSMRAAGNISTFAGNKLSEKTGGKYGESLQKSGAFVKSWGTDIRETRKLEKTKARQKTLEKLGMKGGTMDLGTKALDTKLGRSIKGGMTMGAGALLMSNPLTAGYGAMLMGIGAGHMGGSLSSKWVGKKVKDYSYTRQQNKNINQADRALEDIQKRNAESRETSLDRKLPEYKVKKEKIKEREEFRKSEIKAIDDQLQTDIGNAAFTNQSPAEIDKIKEEAAQKREQINIGIDSDINRIQREFDAQHGDKKLKIEAEVDAEYHPHIEEIKKFKMENEGAKNRDITIKDREKERSKDLLTAEQKRIIQIENVKRDFADGPAVLRDRKIKEVNTQSAAQKIDINKKHDDWIAEYKSRSVSEDKIPNTILESMVPKALNSTGEKIEKSNPNRLTIDAMKLGSKEFIAARDSVKALKDTDNIRAFEGNYWSTPTGINSQQEKFLSLLAENTKDSKEALQNMATGLNKLKGSVSLPKDQDWLANIMRGIAHITSKKPETKNSYTTIIEVLDSLHESKKVEQFKPKTT